MNENLPFWQKIPLSEMPTDLWESLCDRCGLCCLHKLEDIDSKELFFTNIACKFLDIDTCECSSYADRNQKAEGCILLTPEKAAHLNWLPETCAYRLIAEGKNLQWWHPLISGNPNSVHQAGISVRGRCISENTVDMDHLEDYIISSQS